MQDRLQHGCCSRAYMDVFTACPALACLTSGAFLRIGTYIGPSLAVAAHELVQSKRSPSRRHIGLQVSGVDSADDCGAGAGVG
jgi:hypothetical protein